MRLRLAWLEGQRYPLVLLVLALLVMAGTAAVALAWSLTGHAGDLARAALSGSTEQRRLVVTPRQLAEGQRLAFTPRHLSDEDLALIAALPGLDSQRIFHGVPLPTTIRVQVPGIIDSAQFLALLATDLDGLPADAAAVWDDDGPSCPIVLHPQVVPLYNLGLADRYGLPRMDPSMLMGVELHLEIGSDVFRQMRGHFRVPARLVAYDPDASLWGATVPRQRAEDWLRRLHDGVLPPAYGPVQAVLRFADGASFAAAREMLVERDLVLDGETALATALVRAEAALAWLLRGGGLLALLLLAAAVAALAMVSAAERERACRLYRQCGAGLIDLALIFGLLPALTTALAALLGLLLAQGLIPSLALRLRQHFVPAELQELLAQLQAPALPGLAYCVLPLLAALLTVAITGLVQGLRSAEC